MSEWAHQEYAIGFTVTQEMLEMLSYNTCWLNSEFDEEGFPDGEPLWCGGCGSAEDPCDCYTRAFNACDALGVPFRPAEGMIWAGMTSRALDIQHLQR